MTYLKRTFGERLLGLGMGAALAFCILNAVKSCNTESDSQFDVTTSARAYSPIALVDTTKPSQIRVKPVVTHYTLSGSDTLFNLLWIQINSPLDVTPRQLNTLKDWVQRGLKQDTTNIK